MPLWIYTAGDYIIGDESVKGGKIEFPFVNVVQSIAMLVVPLTLGILIKRFLPKLAKYLLYLQIPSIIAIVIFAVGLSKFI